jgi:hypothetical protein
MSTPAKVQLNWSNVTYNSIQVTRITSGSFNLGGNVIFFSGDANIYNVVAGIGVNAPTASFTTADIGSIWANFPVGTNATLIAQLNDANNITSGGVEFTVTQAIYLDTQSSAQHAQFGSGTMNFGTLSPDGLTNPVTISRY